MRTAIVTDGKYRMSIAAVRALSRAGYRVVVTQTRGDAKAAPAVSVSRHCAQFRWIDGCAADTEYRERLLSVLQEYEKPVLFCVGAATLNMIAAQREEFASFADFLIASKPILDQLNDKERNSTCPCGTTGDSCTQAVRYHTGCFSGCCQAALRRKIWIKSSRALCSRAQCRGI